MKLHYLTGLNLLSLLLVCAFLAGTRSTFSLAQTAAPVIKIAYEDLPRIVAGNNSILEARRSEVLASQARTGHLERSFFPELEIESSFDAFRFGSGSWRTQPDIAVSARINLFNGGRDSLQEQINQALVDRSQTNQRIIYRELLSRARQLYWQQLYILEKLQIIDEALKDNLIYERQARQRVSAGRGRPTDIIEFELQRNEWQQTRSQISLNLLELESQMQAILGIEGNTRIQLSSSLFKPTSLPNEAVHSKDHHHLSATLEVDGEIRKMQAELARRSYYPRIDLFGGLQQHNQRERDEDRSWERFEQVFGLRVLVPLGTMTQTGREQRALEHEAAAIQIERRQRLREFDQHIEIERKKAIAIEGQIANASKNIDLARKYLSLILEDYRLGVKNSQDVLSASERLIDLRLRLASLIFESKLAFSHLESYLDP